MKSKDQAINEARCLLSTRMHIFWYHLFNVLTFNCWLAPKKKLLISLEQLVREKRQKSHSKSTATWICLPNSFLSLLLLLPLLLLHVVIIWSCFTSYFKYFHLPLHLSFSHKESILIDLPFLVEKKVAQLLLLTFGLQWYCFGLASRWSWAQ